MKASALVLRPEFRSGLPQGGQDPAPLVPRSQEGGPPAPGTETQEQPPQGQQPVPTPCGTDQLLMIGALILVFYFVLLRPSQRQEKARKAMLAELKKGDKVVTNGGIHGTVRALTESTVVLLVDGEGKVKLTVDRGAIGRVQTGEAAKGGGAG